MRKSIMSAGLFLMIKMLLWQRSKAEFEQGVSILRFKVFDEIHVDIFVSEKQKDFNVDDISDGKQRHCQPGEG